MATVTLDPSNAALHLRTGVTGSAARMGHRLVLEVGEWRASVELRDQALVGLRLVAQVASLRVLSGEGGVKPLSEGDRGTIAENARKSLDAGKYPLVTFECTPGVALPAEGGDVALAGTLTLHGQSRPITVVVAVAGGPQEWTLAAQVPVRQGDFGVKPYSAMMGQLRVADEVGVEFSATLRV